MMSSGAGLELAHGRLVTLYLAHPKVFAADNVLGPACVSILDKKEALDIIRKASANMMC